MTVFVGDILNASAATVTSAATPTRTWQWLRSGTALSGFTGTSYRVLTGDAGSTLAIRQTETNFMGAASATSAPTATVGAWSPSTLFALSEPGVWYDADDYTTMFQDPAGTTPITGAGQTVGLLLDKSKGLVLGPELVTNGDFSGGSTGWTGGTVSGGQISVPLFGEATQAISLTAGRTYRVSFDINASAGMGRVTVGGTLIDLLNVSRVGAVYYIVTTNTTALRVGCISGTSVSFDNISVRELPGFHATQSTLASRPTTVIRPMNAERRNLLTRTEEFENAVWTRQNLLAFGSGSTVNSAVAPDNTTTGDRIVETNDGVTPTTHSINSTTSLTAGVQYVFSFYAKGASSGRYIWVGGGGIGVAAEYPIFDVTGGTVDLAATTTVVKAATITPPDTNGWRRCSVTFVPTATTAASIGLTASATDNANVNYVGNGTSGVDLWGAQLEQASSATPYQKVVTTNEWYDPAVPSYRGIQFDGVDDFLVTPTITPGTDKAQIFAGVRKLSDAATAVIAETSADWNSSTGTFVFGTGTGSSAGPNYSSASRGNASAALGQYAVSAASFSAPVTSVVTVTHDIPGDLSAIRVNGSASGTNGTGDKGSGAFFAHPIYIGRRGGTTAPLNGILTSLVVRFGANLSTSVINRAEYYVSDKTGVSL